MEIRQLRYFVRITDAGSFSRASQVLHIAQPALSHQIMQLEDELNQQLFHRKHTGVEPTEQGRALYRNAVRILKEIDDLTNVVNRVASELNGKVAIGLPQSTALHYALLLLDEVSAKHPGISLEFFDEISGNLFTGVDSGRLDIAILFDEERIHLLDSTPLMEEELFLTSQADGIDSGDIPLRELEKLPLTLPGIHHGVRALVEGALLKEGGILPAPTIEANSMSIMLNCIESGRASGIMPWAAVHGHLKTRSFKIASLKPRLSRKVFVCTSKNYPPSLATIAVKNLLIESVRKQVIDGAWEGAKLL